MLHLRSSSSSFLVGSSAAGLSLIGIALCACSPQDSGDSASAPQAAPSAAAEPFIPEATVLETMHYVVMPNAAILWDAVGTIVTETGVEVRAPKTDEDWESVRGAAITLAEASNALMIPGRDVDVAGAPAASPEELTADQIQDLREREWDAWVAHAVILHKTVTGLIDAIDNRDATALMDAGGPLDEACESCHLQFWYPPDPNPEQ